jgi:ABC-type microcin C transport system permease subunit YejB
MHYVIQALIISVAIGLLWRTIRSPITIPLFVKKCAAVVFGSALQGLGFALGGLVLSIILLMLFHR